MSSDSVPRVPDAAVEQVRLGVVDAGELLTLHRAAYVSEAVRHQDLTIPQLVRPLAQLRDDLADPAVVSLGLRLTVAAAAVFGPAGRLVATARMVVTGDRTAELGRFAVAPDLQGRGLGSRVIAAVEAAVPPGVRRLRLFTGEHSVANLRLYARLGYVETHRTRAPAGYELVHLVKRRA